MPPPNYQMDPDAYFLVDAKSQVTGAGIATLQSKPDAASGNVYLIAPRGTVDAGAAGIRVSGDLHVAALQVQNAFNIQVQGTSVGLPTFAGTNTVALTAANNTAGASLAKLAPTAKDNSGQPSSIIVEVLGYGGEGNERPADQDDRRKEKRSESQDPSSRVQVLDAGELTPERRRQLADERRRSVEQP